jgi:GT2 family glycosyltransferase
MDRNLDKGGRWPGVYVCLLNWNGWRDTLQCLESLLAIDYPSVRIVICDNGSTDDSCEQLVAWVAAHEAALRQQSAGESALLDVSLVESQGVLLAGQRVVLIRNGANLGFAAGNNSGLAFAMTQPDCEYVWLLNNDTVVDAQALKALVNVFRADPKVGTCGSRLVYFHAPDRVQALGGGVYSSWFSLARHVGEHMPVRQAESIKRVAIDYPCAASMLISRSFLQNVGLMSEDYFLYFEELDWMRRAGNRFNIGYAWDSVVFHKEGQSIGSDGRATGRSLLSDYYLTRSRFVFTKKFHPYALPTLVVWLGVMVIARLVRQRGEEGRGRARLVFQAALDGLTGRFRTLMLSRDKPANKPALEN